MLELRFHFDSNQPHRPPQKVVLAVDGQELCGEPNDKDTLSRQLALAFALLKYRERNAGRNGNPHHVSARATTVQNGWPVLRKEKDLVRRLADRAQMSREDGGQWWKELHDNAVSAPVFGMAKPQRSYFTVLLRVSGKEDRAVVTPWTDYLPLERVRFMVDEADASESWLIEFLRDAGLLSAALQPDNAAAAGRSSPDTLPSSSLQIIDPPLQKSTEVNGASNHIKTGATLDVRDAACVTRVNSRLSDAPVDALVAHQGIAQAYLESVKELTPIIRRAAVAIAKSRMAEWREQIHRLRTTGTPVSHGDDIAITRDLVGMASTYVLVWQRAFDPKDPVDGWAGGWARFLDGLKSRRDLGRHSIIMLPVRKMNEQKHLVLLLEEEMKAHGFATYRCTAEEVITETSSNLPTHEDFEIIGKSLLKFVRPIGKSYRDPEGVVLTLRELLDGSDDLKLVKHVLECSGCSVALI
jgi:hypothetical protein